MIEELASEGYDSITIQRITGNEMPSSNRDIGREVEDMYS